MMLRVISYLVILFANAITLSAQELHQDVAIPLPGSFEQCSGANLPWINYGWDIGRQPWGGAHGGFSSNADRLESDLQYLASHKVGLVRVFIFCDCRSGFQFDSGGTPTGFDSYVYADMAKLIELASTYEIKLMPVLFDYLIADGIANDSGTPVGEHTDVISNSTKRALLCSQLASFASHFGSSSTIVAWDVINEPEWSTAVSTAEMKTFIQDVTNALHQATPSIPVTVGSASLASTAQWFGLGLDFYQPHYYEPDETLLSKELSFWGFDRPALIGETYPVSVATRLLQARNSGYKGCLFWSLNADYDFRGVADEYAQAMTKTAAHSWDLYR